MARCWLLLLFLLAGFLLPAASAASCHPDDLRALRGFARGIRGGGVLLRAAWTGASCCGWVGVTCDGGASGRVTTLWLPGRGLAGPIPAGASLAGLARLESLNLANNRLVGAIPSWIGDLDHLCYLDLSHNSQVVGVPRSMQIRLLRGLGTAGYSQDMAFTCVPMHVKPSRRTLDEQPNTITGSHNTVRSGSNNVVTGNDNTVISGNNNVVSGSHNTVLTGSDNVVSGNNLVVPGNNHVVSGNNNVVSGSHNTVYGSNNIVSGSNHVVSGNNKVVTGG